MGDSLLVTPLIETIRHSFINSKLTLLAHKRMYVLFEKSININEIGIISESSSKYKGWSFTKKFDLAFVVSGPEENGKLLTRYALRVSDKVVSFKTDEKRINKRLYAAVTRDFSKNIHIVDYYHSLTNALKISPSNKRVGYKSSPSELLSMQQVMDLSVVKKCKIIIGLKITSLGSRSYRDWPFDNFVELSHLIGAKYPDVGIIILGGLDEFDKYEELSRKIDLPVLNLSGANLREMGAIMNFFDLYIGVDTGVTHLISSLNIPMIVLYHPLAPKSQYSPINHPRFYPLECYKNSILNINKEDMMATIGSNRVFEKINSALTDVTK